MKNKKLIHLPLTLLASITLVFVSALPARAEATIGINVLLKGRITQQTLTDLGKYGRVAETAPTINLVTLKSTASKLSAIQALPYVAAANPDQVRNGSPIDTVSTSSFVNIGYSTWDMDAVNATIQPFSVARGVPYDGTGVYVAVIDTGLVDSWRQYFPQQRISSQYAKAFRGGGNDNGNISEPPNMWEHDQNSHGTHVTSTILGYKLGGAAFNGVAPMATVIPVKVLGQNGSGWSSVVARGIVYVASLKAGPLAVMFQ